MVYMRIDRNKFWGWVVVSLLVGLLVGLGVMFIVRGSSAATVTTLEKQVATLSAQSKEASDTIAAMQASLASAEASITDLTAKNSQLTSDLATAKAAAKKTTVAAGSLTITSRSVSPQSVEASHTLVLTVKVTGHPDKVRMQILGTGSVSSYDQTYYLSKVSTSGNTETWRRSIKAPAKKGVYRYYAGAFIGTKKVTMPGVSALTFQVK